MKKVLLPLLLAASMPAGAVEIELDYTYDTQGFFNQPGSKACLRAVADYYETLLRDSLSRIDASQNPGMSWSAKFEHPGTGADQFVPNLVVPADTLIVYAGGRSLGGPAGVGGPGGYTASGNTPWFNLLASRGEAGALATPKTDFAPWGGIVTFDTASIWSFSTSGPESGKVPFTTIALHEIGHLLGIGTSASWNAGISGGDFTGNRATAAFGSPVPLDDGAHWLDDGNCSAPDGHIAGDPFNVLSESYGSFGAPHGFAQIALMDPSSCSAGAYLKVMTDLDLAALSDIGWEVVPPLRWTSAQYKRGAGPVAFSWNTTTGFTYRVETGITLDSWSTLSTVTGNGNPASYTHPSPPAGKAFYRLNTDPPAAPAAPRAAPVYQPAPASMEPVIVEGCRMGASWGVR